MHLGARNLPPFTQRHRFYYDLKRAENVADCVKSQVKCRGVFIKAVSLRLGFHDQAALRSCHACFEHVQSGIVANKYWGAVVKRALKRRPIYTSSADAS